ncbi:MAG: hypothetical protein ACT4PP_03755 [Sporichthyaceae bacterium]
MENLAPVRMQRLASFLPWALVSLILLYGGSAGDESRDKIIGYGGAAVFALVSFRAARMRLLLGDQVVIVGWLRARKLAWSEVERFVVTKKGLTIKLRGGLEEAVPAFPMGAWMLPSMRESMQSDLQRTAARAEDFRRRRRPKRK